MAELLFDANNQADIPTLILETKSGERYGAIDGVTGICYRKNLNGADEAEFVIHKYADGRLNPLWDDVTDLKTLYIPEYNEKFEIRISYEDEENETKSVTAVSLCEAELSQIILRNFEVNTETDISRDDYEMTVFYNPDKPKGSLLHRVLSEKAVSYKIGHVDQTLMNLAYEFSANDTDIYSFLTGDVAEQVQCLFLFDSMTRTINAYDLCSTCNDCYENTVAKQYDMDGNEIRKHYRGDFHDVCPNCGSRNIKSGYGKDTTILIDKENIADTVTVTGDADSLKNCFYVEGGDDAVTSAFCMINPNGTQYLYYFPPDELDKSAENRIYKFPDELIDAINAYNRDYRWYYSENVYDPSQESHIYHPETESFTPVAFNPENTDLKYVTAFNDAIRKISALSDKSPYCDCGNYQSPLSFKGQGALVTAYYNAVDLGIFLKSGMMPTYEMEVYSKEEAIRKLTSSSIGTIAISGFGSGTVKTVADNAVLMAAKTIINTALFSVGIESSSYASGSAQWSGRFIVTDLQNDDVKTNTIVSPQNVTLTINGDMITYCKNRISYMLSKDDLPTAENLYDLTITDDYFRNQIRLYSIDSLGMLYNVMQSCMDVLQEQLGKVNIRPGNSVYDELKRYYDTYHRRMGFISSMISKRENDLKIVNQYGALMYAYIDNVRTILDFPSYLKRYAETHSIDTDLWEVFNLHRREDTYQNSNIISDALETNSDVIRHAGYLMEVARKELVRAGTMQYSISASLSNLLMIPEFAPLVEHFDTGNWIRVRTDIREDRPEDSIYKLRLLSYQIFFDDLQNIEVEFSTVTDTWCGIQDINSINNSVQNMATSYDGIKRQAEKSSETTDIVDNWVSDGLDMTNQKIVSSADNQSFLIDNHGLLARSYDDLADVYDPCQLKILNNGLYTTHNGWESVDAGIGKFIYYDPENDFRETVGYGLIARTVIGSLILGENLGIYNKNGSMRFNDDGLSVSNGKNTISINPNGNAFEILKGTEKQLYIDMDGNVSLAGGGCLNIESGDKKVVIDPSGKTGSGYVFQVYNGSQTSLGIDLNGNAVFRGAIYADSGEFKGDIKSGSTITGAKITGGTIGTESGRFYVDESGKTTVKDLVVTDSVYGQYTLSGQKTGTKKVMEFISTPAYSYNRIFYDDSFGGFVSMATDFKGIAKQDSSINFCTDVCTFDSVSIFKNVTDFRGNAFFKSTAVFYNGAVVHKALSVEGNSYLNGDASINKNLYINNDLEVKGVFSTSGDTRFDGSAYFHSLVRLEKEGEKHISAKWADGGYHTLLNLYEDGLKLAVGWNGESSDEKIYPNELVLRGQTVTAPNTGGMAVTSDERLKNSFDSLDKFDSAYMELEPVSFRYNNGSSGRKHFGFGAGQVKNVLEKHNFTTRDFAGFVQMKDDPDSMDYCGIEDPMGLIYTEFIAWNTHMIQKTRKELDEIRHQLEDMSAKIQ